MKARQLAVGLVGFVLAAGLFVGMAFMTSKAFTMRDDAWERHDNRKPYHDTTCTVANVANHSGCVLVTVSSGNLTTITTLLQLMYPDVTSCTTGGTVASLGPYG